MMAGESGITLVTLGVSDVAAATCFYEKLGWRRSSASNEQVTFFHSNGTVLGLFSRQDLAKDAHVDDTDAGFSGISLARNYNSEEEVDQAFQHAVDSGARPLKPPKKVFWGGYSGYYADPDGHLWEVAYNPLMPLNADGHMQLP